MDSKVEKDELQQPMSACRRLKWTLICVCSLLDLGSVIALGPSVLALQEGILQHTTDCGRGEALSCAASVVKYTATGSSIKALTKFVLATPYGNAVDRYGRKPMFAISIFGSFLSLPFLLGTPTSLLPFLIMDTLGGLLPQEQQIISTIVADVSDQDTRAIYFARMIAVTSLIAILGSAVGGMVVASFGSQGLVIGSLSLSVIQLTVVLLFLPETRPTQKETLPTEKQTEATPVRKQSTLKDILIIDKSAGQEARWQRSFFWLYIVSGLPIMAIDSISMVFLQERYNFTPADMGYYMSNYSVCSFVWLLLGFNLLQRICPNDGRIFQTIKLNGFVCQMILFLSSQHWVPYALNIPFGMNGLDTVILRGIMLNATEEAEVGYITGLVFTCDALMQMVAPALGGAIFSLSAVTGLMYMPFLFTACGPVPLQIAISSFTILPESMPPSVRARAGRATDQEGTNEQLLSTEDNEEKVPKALNMSAEAWERKHPPLSMAVKYIAPFLFIFCVAFIAGNEQEFACRDRSYYEAKAAVSVIASMDPNERDGQLVFFRGTLERGSIINQTLPDLGPYFALPPDFESPSLVVSVEAKQCVESSKSEYIVKWRSSYINSSKFNRDPKTSNFEMVCGAENYWNPLFPHPGSYDADAGKVGAFTILWATDFTKEIALNALLRNSSMLTEQGRKEAFSLGRKKCDPGFSFCQDWKGNRTPNDIGEARISMKTFDWNKPTMTILGQNSGGSISNWSAPNSWLCDNFGRNYVGVIKSGSHSIDRLLNELKPEATIRTWIFRIMGFALAWVLFCILASPLHIRDNCIAYMVPWRPHLKLPNNMLGTLSVIGASCLLSVGLCMLVGGSVWAITWPFLGTSLLFMSAGINFFFWHINRKHGILMIAGARTSIQASIAGARTSIQASITERFQNIGIQ